MNKIKANKVDFIIAGCAKSGTTALYNILDKHPDICMTPIKETNYFFQGFTKAHRELLNLNGKERLDGWSDENIIRSEEQYNNLFSHAEPDQLIGEASPLYMLDKEIPLRLKNYNPKMKIIISLRNPSDVAWANFVMQCRDGAESIDVNDTQKFLDSARYNNPKLHPFSKHLEIPAYLQQLPEYFQVFKGNLHIIIFEEFLADKPKVIEGIYNFLNIPFKYEANADNTVNVSGMPKNVWLRDLMHNSTWFKRIVRLLLPKKVRHKLRARVEAMNTGKKVKMPTDVRQQLDEIYKDDRQYVEKELGLDITSWKEKLAKNA